MPCIFKNKADITETWVKISFETSKWPFSAKTTAAPLAAYKLAECWIKTYKCLKIKGPSQIISIVRTGGNDVENISIKYTILQEKSD